MLPEPAAHLPGAPLTFDGADGVDDETRAASRPGRSDGPRVGQQRAPRSPRPARQPRRLVAAAAIIADGTVLAARRTAPPAVAGRWELPGGKVEAGESPEQAAVREVREELGVAVRVGRRLGRRHPIRPGMSLVVVLAELLEPAPTRSVVHDRLRWLRPEELGEVDWLPADRPLLDLLRTVLGTPDPLGPGTPASATAARSAAGGRRGRRTRARQRARRPSAAAPPGTKTAAGPAPGDAAARGMPGPAGPSTAATPAGASTDPSGIG